MDTKRDTSTDQITEEISFGAWLRQRRRSLDLTQQALADEVGCARITLRRIEAGELKPSNELAQILLEKVNIPPAERERWVRFARGLTGLPSATQPIAETRPPTNLPALLTSFIGREKEQTDVTRLLQKHRLVMLVGPGGVGKTRLSLKIGEQLLTNYPNGVWLAELAPLNHPELIPQTIATIFGITSSSALPFTEVLINFLRAKTTLLILDNCEHLLDGCAQLADTLLKQCPKLKILATSREPLGILGEATYQVPSLGLPDTKKLLDQFREFESVSLFEERAQLVQSDFRLTVDNVTAVAQICTRLDGIPLAIELAAMHVRLLSPAEIAAQLDHCFDLLTGGSRTALPRQQTIRASVDWSWNLLTAPERDLLRRLSIFAGGWTLESAQAVCQDDLLHDNQIKRLMAQLVSKSLVRVNQLLGRETRYNFHEIVRQYAREKLAGAGEVAEVRTRHLQYFSQLVEQAEPALRGPEQVAWVERLFDECDNIRAALDWADQTNEVEAGLLMAGRLMERFWYDFNIREGERWLHNFLERPTSHSFLQARARALLAYAFYADRTNQKSLLEKTAGECLATSRTVGDPYGEIDALIMLARRFRSEDRVKSIEFSRQALVLAESLGDLWRKAIILARLAWCSSHPQNISYWREATSLVRQVGDLRLLAIYLGQLGSFELLAGDLASAQAHIDEAVQVNNMQNRKGGMESIYEALSELEVAKGNFEKARIILKKEMAVAAELGHHLHYLMGLVQLGLLSILREQLAEAHDLFWEAIQQYRKAETYADICYPLEGMAGVYMATNRPVSAVRLIGWTNTIHEQVNLARSFLEQANVDKIMATCPVVMGEVAFAAAYEEGQKMTLDEVIGLVWAETDTSRIPAGE